MRKPMCSFSSERICVPDIPNLDEPSRARRMVMLSMSNIPAWRPLGCATEELDTLHQSPAQQRRFELQ